MTNAPFMMNVDCDMYANNPQIFHHEMCLLLGSKNEQECGFVQTPQFFYDGLKDDLFGNQLVVWYKVISIVKSNLFHTIEHVRAYFFDSESYENLVLM